MWMPNGRGQYGPAHALIAWHTDRSTSASATNQEFGVAKVPENGSKSTRDRKNANKPALTSSLATKINVALGFFIVPTAVG